jgi:DNA-binding winged helix-turn-helix (wHTH) protein
MLIISDLDDDLHGATPVIDDDGLLRHRGAWVALTPHDERVLRLLLDHLGRPVPRHQLSEAVWPGLSIGASTLNTLMHRLRRRLWALGLGIRAVPGQGFALEQLDHGTLTTPTLAGLAGGQLKGSPWLIS